MTDCMRILNKKLEHKANTVKKTGIFFISPINQ
jgi:hypothetical protein